MATKRWAIHVFVDGNECDTYVYHATMITHGNFLEAVAAAFTKSIKLSTIADAFCYFDEDAFGADEDLSLPDFAMIRLNDSFLADIGEISDDCDFTDEYCVELMGVTGEGFMEDYCTNVYTFQ